MKKIKPINGQYWYLGQAVRGRRSNGNNIWKGNFISYFSKVPIRNEFGKIHITGFQGGNEE